MESSDETNEICERNDDFQTFSNYEDLNTLHELLDIFFSRISFRSERNDNKVKVDEDKAAVKEGEAAKAVKTWNEEDTVQLTR